MSTRPRKTAARNPARLAEALRTTAASKWAWLTLSAFVILLAALFVRLTVSDSIREPFHAALGTGPMPRTGGPATGIGLDLLCIFPALLVLLRRAVDREYWLRWNWSVAPLLLLTALAAASTAWAADRFAAAVGAAHFIAAGIALWTASQLIGDWKRFRLLSAFCVGMLALLIVSAICYRWMDQPENLKFFEQNKQEIFSERGIAPGSFEATQFASNLTHGLFADEFASANTLGAVTTLLLLIVLGCGIERLRHGDSPTELEANPDDIEGKVSIGLLALIAGGGIFVESYAASKAAGATLIIGAILLLVTGRLRDRLPRRAARLYFGGVILLCLLAAAVIGHGLHHHNLAQSSLTFRWQYWVGSMKLLAHHWRLGTGWNNFGYYYLQYRLPVASEEIKSPHNFFVQFFTELGIAGGILAILWMLRLWWEMTRPVSPPDPEAGQTLMPPTPRIAYEQALKPLRFLPIVAVIGTIITCGCGIDWRQDVGYICTEILKRVLLLCAFVIGASAGALRTLKRDETDQSVSPWLLYSVIIALGMFLVHNLIDFSFFESGPMLLFAVLAGGVLAMRKPSPAQAPTPAHSGKRGLAALGFSIAALAWLAAACGFWGTILAAEHYADAADALVDATDPKSTAAAQTVRDAAALLVQAHQIVPYNADYDDRIGLLLAQAVDLNDAIGWFDAAIGTNPFNTDYYFDRLSAEQRTANPNGALIRQCFEQVLKLDPADVRYRLRYADYLGSRHDPAAREQYLLALQYNDALESANHRRLSPDEVKAAKEKAGIPSASK